jgi:hypothetical protein
MADTDSRYAPETMNTLATTDTTPDVVRVGLIGARAVEGDT